MQARMNVVAKWIFLLGIILMCLGREGANFASAESVLLILGASGETLIEIADEPQILVDIAAEETKRFDLECSNGFSMKDEPMERHTIKKWDKLVFRLFLGRFPGVTSMKCTFISKGKNEAANWQEMQRKELHSTYYEDSPEYSGVMMMKEGKSLKIGLLRPEDYQWKEGPLEFDAACEAILQRVAGISNCPSEKQKPFNAIQEKIAQGRAFYISMTTSPSRLLKLHYTLRSLTWHLPWIKSIFVTLPFKFKNKDSYVIPKALIEEFPQLVFLSANIDIGPCLKAIGAAQWLKSQGREQDYLLYLDDDGAYGPSMGNTLFSSVLAYESDGEGDKIAPAVVGGSNLNFGFSTFCFPRPNWTPKAGMSKAMLLEGFAGIAVKIENIDIESIVAASRRDLNPKLAICHHSDDVVISWCMMMNGVALYGSGPGWQKGARTDFPYCQDMNALHRISHDDQPSGKGHFFNYRQAFGTMMKFSFGFEKVPLDFVSRDEFLKNILASHTISVAGERTETVKCFQTIIVDEKMNIEAEQNDQKMNIEAEQNDEKNIEMEKKN